MKSRISLFIVLLLTWLLLSWDFDWRHWLVGAVVALLISVLTGDLFIRHPKKPGHALTYLWLFVYLPLFVWECFKANIDVALRVINPALPITPGIVKAKTKLRSEIGLTFLANSITLTPGTLSVDVDGEQGFLYVHWINVKGSDVETATREIVSRFERILEKMFD